MVIGVEDKESWHGKPLSKDLAEQAIKEIQSRIQSNKKLTPTLPVEDAPSVSIKNIKMLSPPNFKMGDKVCKDSSKKLEQTWSLTLLIST